MKVLATDLDRTLLPNGRWPADPGAVALFNTLTDRHDLLVVYVTGRSVRLTEEAIREFGLRYPDTLIGDVGSSIQRYSANAWIADRGWATYVRRTSPRWDAQAVRTALADVDGLVEQDRSHCGAFKQSWYLDHERRASILAQVEQRAGNRFDAVVIYSHDSETGHGLLDLVPASATKQTALEYVADSEGVARRDVVFCGDSGNDVFPLTAEFSGVLVRNADEQLVGSVKRARVRNPDLRVYFAQGGFRGLNGYYTGGVLEGAAHYGLFDEVD